MALDNKITNILGAAMPTWLKNQLFARYTVNSLSHRDDDNLLYLANKTAWIRVVSSVNVTASDLDYFKNLLDPEIRSTLSDITSLAKNYILYGGTSKYLNPSQNSAQSLNPPNYQLRSGLSPDGSYGILGSSEVQNYGYRPMPGITDARIETQGRLGSVRMATINFKVWDKMQLDIIDALYFKLGYSMLIEWGNTVFTKLNLTNKNPIYDYSELYSIDPFAPNQTKESINLQITKNVRSTEGNYDAMLGLVSNFDFSYNQDGGYDCSLRVIGLGTIGESIKINHDATLPEVAKEQLKIYAETLAHLLAQANANATNSDIAQKSAEQLSQIKNAQQQGKLLSYDDLTSASNSPITILQYYTDSKGGYNKEFTENGIDGNLYSIQSIKTILGDSKTYLSGQSQNQYNTFVTIDTSYLNNIFNQASKWSNNYGGSFWRYLIEPTSSYGSVQLGGGYYIQPYGGGFLGTISEITSDFTTYNTYEELLKSSSPGKYQQIEIDIPMFVGPISSPSQIIYSSDIANAASEGLNSKPDDAYFYVALTLAQQNESPKIQLLDESSNPVQPNLGNLINNTTQNILGLGVDNPFISALSQGNSSNENSFVKIADSFTQKLYSDSLLGVPMIKMNFGSEYNSGNSIEDTIVNFLNAQQTDIDHQFSLVSLSMSKFNYNNANNQRTTTVAPKLFMKYSLTVDVPYFYIIKNSNASEVFTNAVSNGIYQNTLYSKKGKMNIFVNIETNDVAIINKVSFANAAATPPEPSEYAEQQVGYQKVEPAAVDEEAIANQVKYALQYQSNIEFSLKSIELYALNKASSNFYTTNSGSISDKKISVVSLAESKNRSFLTKLFQEGVFKNFIGDLVDDKITDDSGFGLNEQYVSSLNNAKDDVKLKIFSKYGFASGILGGHEPGQNSQNPDGIFKVDYKDLLKTYVLPYSTNPSNEGDIQILFPVYIQFGFLLMLLNNLSTIYDRTISEVSNIKDQVEVEGSTTNSSNKVIKPLTYIDYNPETNLCLSQPTQFSTNVFDFLIPMQTSLNDYKKIFPPNVLDGNYIKAQSISKNTGDNLNTQTKTKLFDPSTDDFISKDLPKFRIESGKNSGVYKGKTMKILISIQYLMDTIQEYTQSDGTNSVYLKPFIERILKDLNNYFGTLNSFRFAYFDSSNTFAIVDDQVQPLPESQKMVSNAVSDTAINMSNSPSDEIPVYGKQSIARSINIKTEVGTKLGNMIAISANSNTSDQAGLGKNASSFGVYNTLYKDRYIPVKNEDSSKISKNPSNSLIDSAVLFNNTIYSFYGKDFKPSKENISQTTNFYINGITKVQNEDPVTRASTMIPVSAHFSLDGISGFYMGQAFTIPEMMLPYTYTSARLTQQTNNQFTPIYKKVGFATVGVTHNISSNTWITEIKGQMIFLKRKEDFSTGKLNTSYSQINSPVLNDDSTLAIDSFKGLKNYSNYPAVNSSLYSNIKLGGSTFLGNPMNDDINPQLLSDVNTAALNSGLIVTITTAITGHKIDTSSGNLSRHTIGNAVDVAIINGNAVSPSNTDVPSFVEQLVILGYVENPVTGESGHPKVVLTYPFKGHSTHVHISNKP